MNSVFSEVPNGDDRNWGRVSAAIGGFRVRYGRWPQRVVLMPIAFVDLVSDVFTPFGFAIVSSVVELLPEEDAEMIAFYFMPNRRHNARMRILPARAGSLD